VFFLLSLFSRGGLWFFFQLVREVPSALIDFAAGNAVWLVNISISKPFE